MGIKQELGKKIKRMRQKRNLTQEKLAEMVNISQRTLSGIEIGENFCTADTLDKLILALDTTPEELFALNHVKNEQELKKELIECIKILDNQDLEIAYKVVKGLLKE